MKVVRVRVNSEYNPGGYGELESWSVTVSTTDYTEEDVKPGTYIYDQTGGPNELRGISSHRKFHKALSEAMYYLARQLKDTWSVKFVIGGAP